MQEQTAETPYIRKYTSVFASTKTIVRLIGYIVIISGTVKVLFGMSEIHFNFKPVLRAKCSHSPPPPRT
jgi:hypothetical protein